MKFVNILSDDAVLEELGQRILSVRLERRMTQAQLAAAAGVSKSTVERLEDGASTQLTNLIRCLRALDKLEGLDRFLPETPTNPVEMLKQHGTRRSRVRLPKGGGTSQSGAGPSKDAPLTPSWVWGDKK